MGVYDDYGREPCVQLKLGPCLLHHYRAGDAVDITDGLYVGWGGFVLVEDGVLRNTYAAICTSHGKPITGDEIMMSYNPLSAVIEAAQQNAENQD